MRVIIFSCFFGILALSSCTSNKYIFSGNSIYTIKSIADQGSNDDDYTQTDKPSYPDSIVVYKLKKGLKAQIEDKEDYVLIETDEELKEYSKLPIKQKAITLKPSEANSFKGSTFFPAPSSYEKRHMNCILPKKLTYFDSEPVFQLLSIPLRIRPKLTSPALLDSFPSQAETDYNVGFAFGWKLNYNVYNFKKSNHSKKKLTKYSLTPGVFCGFGATDLTKDNTKNPVIGFERSAPILTTGGFLSFGVNKMNIGYAFGMDNSFGTGSSQWVYQGKLWHGIIVALDLFEE